MLCDLVFGILGTLIIAIIIYSRQSIFKDFIKKLNEEQINVLNSLYKERLWITIFGLIFSIIFTYGLSFVLTDKLISNRICLYILLIFFITSLIYILFPKSDYFILHLSKDQMRKWLNLWEYVKFILILGFIVGLIFYFLFSKLIKKIFGVN